jgi:hypothetical protein
MHSKFIYVYYRRKTHDEFTICFFGTTYYIFLKYSIKN